MTEERRVALSAKATALTHKWNALSTWFVTRLREGGILDEEEEFYGEEDALCRSFFMFARAEGESEEDAKEIALGMYAPVRLWASITDAKDAVSKVRQTLALVQTVATRARIELGLATEERRLARYLKTAQVMGLDLDAITTDVTRLMGAPKRTDRETP